MTQFPEVQIRKFLPDEEIPYSLLLLADETIEAIDSYIHNSEIYILEQENSTIGIYVAMLIEPDVIEIKNIAVKEEFHNQGFGLFMLNDAKKRAKEKNCKSIIICTPDIAHKQLYLYQKAGFTIYDIKKNYYPMHYPKPIFEDGVQLKDMVILKQDLR